MVARLVRFVLLAAIVAALSPVARAHDLPTEITVNMFVREEGQRLRFLVRVPMRAMGDVDYPVKGSGGHIDLARVEPALRHALDLWILPNIGIDANGGRLAPPVVLAARISLPLDQSFSDFDSAAAQIHGPALPPDTTLELNQGFLDAELVAHTPPGESAIAIDPRFSRLGVSVTTVVRLVSARGEARHLEFTGDPGPVPLIPGIPDVTRRFLRLGFAHAIDSLDLSLFLICLVIPVRHTRTLFVVVAAFLGGLSLTFLASASGLTPTALWFRPVATTLMAASVVFVAVENVFVARFGHRWIVAFIAGLVHGHGVAFRFDEVRQFSGSHLASAMASFDIGVCVALILVLLFGIPPLAIVFRYAASEKIARIVSSVVIGHVAWHWTVDRGGALSQLSIGRPAMDAAFARDLSGWLLLAVGCTASMWVLRAFARRTRPNQG